MKAHEIKPGQTYLAKVSDRIVPVTVLHETSYTIYGSRHMAQGEFSRRGAWRCRNELTGREILVRSAQRFRGPAPGRGE